MLGLSLALLAIGWAAPAAACDPGADPDADGVCSDVDNCPALANPDQADLDSDGSGNACDAADAQASVVKLYVRRDTNNSGDNSKLKTSGFLFTTPPVDAFSAAAGVTFALASSDAVTRTFAFAPFDCLSTRPGKSVCRSADRLWKVTFKALPKSPQVITYVAAFRRIGLTTVLQGPVTLTLTHGAAIDRVGVISDCRVDSTALNCREF